MNRNVVRLLTLFMVMTLVLAAVAPANATPASAPAGKAASPNGVYIVQMIDPPVVAYTGGIKKYQATAPKAGQKIDPFSPAVVTYAAYLDSTHQRALAAVGGGKKLYDYHFSYNGFAAKLTEAQAKKIAVVAGVMTVTPDEIHTIDTSSTPKFLGLLDSEGLWEQLGGEGTAGEDIIIGVVDSGIWPESLSFSDRTGENGNASKDGKLSYQQIPGWHGKCMPGEGFAASMCNQKLIGAQYFNASWDEAGGIDFLRPWEFNSPRDYNGHGTHTASTSGGNNNVSTTGPAGAFGSISGIAPRARIAMYKALWSTIDASTASGSTSDLVAAIDQAVADGVDVINYSISGTQTNFLDPAQLSFLYAARAGIFVAASAGNSGPAVSTVAHPGPWLTTVAAGTHDRSVSGSVVLGDGSTYASVSVAPYSVNAPLINSTAAGIAGANATAVGLCFSKATNGGVPALDPAKVTGKIVVCDRGTNARVDKSLAVKEAGGLGMILVNVTAGSLNADFHSIPSIHLPHTVRAEVKAYAATDSATATINKAAFSTVPAPYTAEFSSRGPLQAGGGDLLKPDVIAPGQDILAAVAPPGSGGLEFNLYSGTSMSSPHVAGLAALLKDLYPTWTPMMIKSALMTSAYDILDGTNTDPLVIFRQGAGHVRPNSAADPGLVYNAGWNDWLAFLCGATSGVTEDTCTALKAANYSTDPSNLNVASIAIGDLAGVQTVKRTLKNVGQRETYTFSYSGLAGITVQSSLASYTFGLNEAKSYTVTFTTNGAALNSYVGGYITWTGDKGHVVRIPVVIRPVALAAPALVSSNGGATSYNVVFGYNGPFTATPRGLIPAEITADTVADDPTDGSCSLTSPNAKLIPVTIPTGTTYARFSLFDADVNPDSDIDLCVFTLVESKMTLVGSSGSGTSAEEVNFKNPQAGDYTVVVQGWGVNGSSPFKLHTWLLGTEDAGNMTITAPSTAVLGGPGTITLSFTGLSPATRYLGSVVYGGAASATSPTIVRVDKP